MESVAIVSIIFGTSFLIVVAALVLAYKSRSIEHKERLAAIEKGIPLPDLCKGLPENRRHASLQRGIILLFVGVGLAVALYFTTGAGLRVAIWGLFVAFIGVGNLVWWAISRKLDGGAGSQDGCC